MEIDTLTVLHNERAVSLYMKHIKLFKKRSSNKIKLNFKVACDNKFKSSLPDDVEIVVYEKIPTQGSIDHAYNLHTLLDHIKTKWFCIMDPDVYPIVLDWDEKILPLFEEYDVFGIPYSSPDRFYDFPMVHLMFFKHSKFIAGIDKLGLREKNHWNIFMPITKPEGIGQVSPAKSYMTRATEIDRSILLPSGSNKTKKLLKEYNEKYRNHTRPKGHQLPTPDTCWRMPIVFKDLKAFCLKETKINKKELDPEAGRGLRQSYQYALNNGENIFVHLVYASNI